MPAQRVADLETYGVQEHVLQTDLCSQKAVRREVPVTGVPCDREAPMSCLHPQLMGATGVGAQGNERQAGFLEVLQHTVTNSRIGPPPARTDHDTPAFGALLQRILPLSFRRVGTAEEQSPVLLDHLPVEERFLEPDRGVLPKRAEDQPARLLVQPVRQKDLACAIVRGRHTVDLTGHIVRSAQNGVRGTIGRGIGVGQETCRLVEHPEGIVPEHFPDRRMQPPLQVSLFTPRAHVLDPQMRMIQEARLEKGGFPANLGSFRLPSEALEVTSDRTIAVLDYGAGNLTSVACAVRHVGREPLVTSSPEDVLGAGRVIFPGVGAAGASVENLRKLGLDGAIREVLREGRPVLGICIGCQVIFERSEEDSGTTCLGLLPGVVQRFRFPPGVTRKIPHMGWNEVTFRGDHPVFRDVPPGSQFYFVHSYHPAPSDDSLVKGTAVYGEVEFAAAVARGSLVAVQFHAEKSGPPGLQILRNFLDWEPEPS